MLTTKNTAKLKWIATVILLILSMLLSGCSATPNTPDADGEKPEETEPPINDEKKDPLAELSDQLRSGFKTTYKKGSVYCEIDNMHAAFEAERYITDVNNARIKVYYGFDSSYDTIEEYVESGYEFYKNGELFLYNDSGKEVLVGTTDGYFISEKYLVDVEIDDSSDSEIVHYYDYSHSEEITVAPELFNRDMGSISFCILTDNPRHSSGDTEYNDEKSMPVSFQFYYKKIDDGRIVLLNLAEFSKNRDWFYGFPYLTVR